MKKQLIYISTTFSWDWREDWKEYVALAKRFSCQWNGGQKLWRIPSIAVAQALTSAVLELVPAGSVAVRDFNSGKPVGPAEYVTPGYLKRLSRAVKPADPFRCLVEGTEAYLSMPLWGGMPDPEHALYYGLAKVGCAGEWVDGKGFHLKRHVREALQFLVKDGGCPLVGSPRLFEHPFVCELYEQIMEHQPEGVSYLYHRQRAILADDMGLGKTMQAILAAEQVKMDSKGKGLVIVCPVTLVSNWQRELRMWGCEYEDVRIVPYSRLKLLGEIKRKYPVGRGLVVICDEAHYLKNGSAQRTKAFMTFVAEMPHLERLWFLTGTPVTKDFSNLWPLAHMMRHPLAERYGPSQLDNLGAVKVQQVRGAISTHMLCRKKSDILTLPPKIQSVKNIDTGSNFEELFDWDFFVSGSDDEEAYKHLMRLKRLTAEAKIKHTIEMVNQILTEGRKVVVFSDHTDVLKEMKHYYKTRAVVLDGSTPIKERGAAVELFQSDEQITVFLGHIKAAGVGITLTAASDVIFNDFDWLPANMQQAEDRCYRIGQKGTVNVYYMADCNLALDDILCTKLADRSAMIATFEMSKQTVMSAVKAWIKAKALDAKAG